MSFRVFTQRTTLFIAVLPSILKSESPVESLSFLELNSSPQTFLALNDPHAHSLKEQKYWSAIQ